MTEIKEDFEMVRFDGITETCVYSGSFSELSPARLEWRTIQNKCYSEAIGFEPEELKLSEIVEQLKGVPMITIFVHGPLKTEVWQYGNYGDRWFNLGSIAGYA